MTRARPNPDVNQDGWPPLVMVRQVRCPWCHGPWTKAYATRGKIQYRLCNMCLRKFKAIKESAEPRPANIPSDGKQRKKQSTDEG